MNKDEKRRRRKEVRLLQDESTWLQKALFALRKVEAVHDELADLRDEDAGAYKLAVAGKRIELDSLEDAIEERATEVSQTAKQRRQALT